MKDLQNPSLIWLKGWLFLFLGVASAGLLLAELPTLKMAGLLALAIWSFCRAYYFAFYVIEHYVDEGFKFSGLWSFASHAWSRKGGLVKAARTGPGNGGVGKPRDHR
jgi:hypothetical protein